nr:helix-turn-helix transcriptional regulator [Paenibacillus hamazuiensis]
MKTITAEHETFIQSENCVLNLQGFASRFNFTPRELEIISLILMYGLSNKEIANTCRISEKTVKNHLANIMGKLEIGSIRQLFPVVLHFIRGS